LAPGAATTIERKVIGDQGCRVRRGIGRTADRNQCKHAFIQTRCQAYKKVIKNPTNFVAFVRSTRMTE
jgi:hypothetical protein